MQLKTFTF